MGVYVLLLSTFLAAEDPGFTVRFYMPQSRSPEIAVGTSWSPELLSAAESLLAGSQTDKVAYSGEGRTAGIHRTYRESVAREYVVVTFHGHTVSQRIKTEEGERDIAQIVIGLHRPNGQEHYEVGKIYSIDENDWTLHQHVQKDEKKREAFIRALRAIVPMKFK